MALLRVLLGLAGYAGLLFVLTSAMVFGSSAVARLVGAPRFRWFDERPVPMAWWRVVAVRAAGALAPWFVCFGLFFVVFVGEGVPVAATGIEVFAGPARAAGLLDGDRITRVGEQPVSGWEQTRAAIRHQVGPTQVEVERGGQRLQLVVTPAKGRIGIGPRFETQRLGVVAAARQALPMPWLVVSKAAAGFARLSSSQDRPELAGPIAIVSETSKAARSGWGTLLNFLGVMGAYLWPFLGGITLFDAVTGTVFRAAYPDVASSTLKGYRWERLRQALVLSCTGYATLLLALALVTAGVPGALVLFVWALPSSAASFLLVWLAGKDLWGRGPAAVCLLVAMLIPCTIFFATFVLIGNLRRALEAQGFRVTLLRAEPPMPVPFASS
jgi:Peptidase family M50